MSLDLSNSDGGGGNWVTSDDFPRTEDGKLMENMDVDGVCTGIAAIGEIYNQKFNSKSQKVYIRFDVKIGDTVKEFWFSETQSKHHTSNLGKHLRRWRGCDFTPDELEKFTLAAILGKQAHLELKLTAKRSGDGYFVNLDLLKPAVKGKEVEPLETPFIFDIDDPAKNNYDKLPKYVQTIIEERDGGQAPAAQTAAAPAPVTETPAADVSSIPF